LERVIEEGGEDLGMTAAAQHTGSEPMKPLGVVRIECSYPVLALALREILKDEAHVYEGRKPRGAEDPASVIMYSNRRDVDSEVRRIRTFIPDAAVLVFAPHPDTQLVRNALRAGASGFVHAGMHPEQIVRAVRRVSEGKVVIPEELLDVLMAEEGAEPDLAALTPRQREILELVVEGLSNAEIGKRLFLTESTVKQHLYAAYKLLNVQNRIQATKLLRDA
jgi:DNA-binding NarL/FixJ family response regulator